MLIYVSHGLYQRDDFLDRHAEFGAGFLGATAREDALGTLAHGGIGCTEELVSIDDDVDSDCREF